MTSDRSAVRSTESPAVRRARASAIRWRRLWLVAPFGLFLVLTVAVAVSLHFSTRINAVTLRNSIDGNVGSVFNGACHSAGYRHWSCVIGDSEGSGTSTYVVTTVGRCWRAVRGPDGGERPMPKHEHGCVGLLDRVSVGL